MASLYKAVSQNGYEILYLSSRAIGMAPMTRKYLDGIRQVRPASTFVPCRSFSHTNLKSPCVEQATMPFVVEDYKALRLLEQATGP